MKGSSPWTMTPTQPLSPSCLTTAPALQPLDPLVSARLTLNVHVCMCTACVNAICDHINVKRLQNAQRLCSRPDNHTQLEHKE